MGLFTFELEVEEDALVNGMLSVVGRTTLSNNTVIDGYLSVNEDTFLAGSASVGGDLSVEGDAFFEDDVTIAGTLSVLNATSIFSDVCLSGDLKVDGTFAVQSSTMLMGSSWHAGDAVFGSRVELLMGPLSFRHPALDHNGNPQLITEDDATCDGLQETTPDGNVVTLPCSWFVVSFARIGVDPVRTGDFNTLTLKGLGFAQLNPGQEYSFIKGINVNWERMAMGGGLMTGSYEVGDQVMLKGPSTLDAKVAFLDHEDLVDMIGPNPDSNLLLCRNFITNTLKLNTFRLSSDNFAVFMYSPRANVGVVRGGFQPSIQASLVEWVQINC